MQNNWQIGKINHIKSADTLITMEKTARQVRLDMVLDLWGGVEISYSKRGLQIFKLRILTFILLEVI